MNCGVHRDVKPANVLLADRGPKLIDFGIARDLAASTITRTGLAVGTPQFMAPEQLESGRRTGTAADVFALAGLLVFAATGRGPFGEGTPAQLLYAVVHSEPELGEVPAGLRSLLLRCLEKDPAKRPTAARMAQELEKNPGDLSGSEPDPEATVPMAAPGGGRRRRALLVGGAALAVVAVASAALLMDGNASGSNPHGTSAKGAGAPTGVAATTSSTDSAGSPGAGSLSGAGAPGGASSRPVSGAKTPAASPASVSGPASGPGNPAGTSNPGGGGSGGGGTTAPGVTTSGPPVVVHTTTVVTHTPPAPPPSHAPSTTPPARGSAPGSVSGIATHVNAPQYITMTISWNAAQGASGYTVKYTETASSGTPTTVSAAGTSVTINIVPYETVCIQVQASNSNGLSPWSPDSPDCVTASAN